MTIRVVCNRGNAQESAAGPKRICAVLVEAHVSADSLLTAAATLSTQEHFLNSSI